MSKAEEYLLEIGLDSDLLPEFFNNDDKSYYSVPELMESFAQERIKQEREKWEKELEVCKNCGQKRVNHSSESNLCPDRFSFFETTK